VSFGEKRLNVGALCFRIFQTIEVGAKLLGARQGCEIPTNVLAGYTYPQYLPIEGVQRSQMF